MQTIEQFLESKDIRVTAMRLLIYKFLANKQIAVTLSDIENAFEKADRTTLYRTIKTFEEKAIVHQIDDGTGITKYALCENGCNCEIETDLHLHFHCNNCNETICLTEHKIPLIKVPDGFVSENVNLVVNCQFEYLVGCSLVQLCWESKLSQGCLMMLCELLMIASSLRAHGVILYNQKLPPRFGWDFKIGS